MKTESLAKYLKMFYQDLIEDDIFNSLNYVVRIPQRAPENAILRSEPAINLLERMKKVYSEWILPGHIKGENTHNVSITVSVGDDEWEEVIEWMWKNKEFYSGITLLPRDMGTYRQPPFEDISKEKYEELIKFLSKIDLSLINEEEDNTNLTGELACSNGSCEIL